VIRQSVHRSLRLARRSRSRRGGDELIAEGTPEQVSRIEHSFTAFQPRRSAATA